MRRLVRSILILGIVVLGFSAFGQPKAYKAGEKLKFLVEYKVGFLNVDVATIDFTVEDATYKKEPCYKINALAQIMPVYKWFFDLRDEYSVWIERDSLRPLYFESNIKEGSYTLNSNYVYHWDSMKVSTYENRPVWDAPKRRTIELTNETLDAVSMFYILRNIPDKKLENSFTDTLELVFANRIRRVQYSFVGREEIRIERYGKQAALKFKCQLASDSGESFNDGDEFVLWLSDDINKIPLYVETPIKVGSVRVKLYDAKGLVKPIK